MPALTLQELLARVVTWHNRHPLARRIKPSQVHSIGGVALPFAGTRPAAQPAAEPALAPEAITAGHPDHLGHLGHPDGPDGFDADDLFGQAAAPVVAAASPADTTAPTPSDDGAATPPAADDPAQPGAEDAATAVTADLGALEAELAALGDDVPAADPDSGKPDEAADDAADEPPGAVGSEAEAAGAPADEPPGPPDAATAPPAPGDEPEFGPEPPDAGADATTPPDAAPPAAADPAHAPMGGAAPEPEPAAPHAETTPAAGMQAAADAPQPEHATAPAAAAVAAPMSLAQRLQAARQAALSVARGAAPTAPRSGRRGKPVAAAANGGDTDPGPLKPLFDPRFLWPLNAARVARWARRHGVAQPLAPAAWPQRQVAAEPGLQRAARAAGATTPVTRHLMTAAIGVDDRRLRLLVDAEGRILGPRAYDRRRVAAAASSLVLVLALGTWKAVGLSGLASEADGHTEVADATHTPAPAASAPDGASAPEAGAHANAEAHAGHQDTPAEPAHPAEGTGHAGHAAPTDHAAATDPQPHAAADLPHQAAAAAPLGHGPQGAQTTPDSAPGTTVTVTRTPPPAFPERRASGPVARIRPQLSDEVRQAARAQSEAARASAPPRARPEPTPAHTTTYAVVTTAVGDKALAQAHLSTVLSVRARLSTPGPTHGELMNQGNQWVAAMWPFEDQTEAERVRHMLLLRGLKATVVKF